MGEIVLPEAREIQTITDLETIRKLQDTAEIILQFDLTRDQRIAVLEKQGYLAVRAGELYGGLEAERGDRPHDSSSRLTNPSSKQQAQEQLGKSRQTISLWVRLANLPNAYNRVVRYCEDLRESHDDDPTLGGLFSTLLGVLADRHTGNEENYTPEEVLDDVRAVLGEIDLDPASCEAAQKRVKAKAFFGRDDDGLKQRWWGRVFLNPPYQMPLIQRFTAKLVAELPNIKAAILLTNDQTDTLWYQHCARNATLLCLNKGRVSFYRSSGERTAPTNGQTFFYYGSQPERFREVFSSRGLIVEIIDGPQ